MLTNHTLPYPGVVPNVCIAVFQKYRGFFTSNPSQGITSFFREFQVQCT